MKNKSESSAEKKQIMNKARTKSTGKKLSITICMLALLFFYIWFNNTNLWRKSTTEYTWMSHRGVHQTFEVQQVDNLTNTAAIIRVPTHSYLENTIDSIKEAFNCGAQIVELDVMLTKDGKLAVFHDATLEYRTDGIGSVEDYTMMELKQLDIGYGYTADGGSTFPFRGKGIGLMPEFSEVMEAFPDKQLLIHIKAGGVKTAEALSNILDELDESYNELLFFYGGDEAIKYLKGRHPSYKTFAKNELTTGLIKYELLGWTGYIPQELHNRVILLPSDYAPFLWGFPGKFVDRMKEVKTIVILVNGDGSPADGFDDDEERNNIPKGYDGLVWTNRIELWEK